MTAGDGNAGRATHRRAAFKNAADDFRRQFIDGHADYRQGQYRRAAHRVDVGQRIGRGDAPEVMRVVDHRREEIGGRDDGLTVVQSIDRGVVRMLGADHEIRWQQSGRHRRQHVGEQGRRNLAAAAAAVGELGQSNISHGVGRGDGVRGA